MFACTDTDRHTRTNAKWLIGYIVSIILSNVYYYNDSVY